MTIRKIKTNTFSKKANEMLRSVIGQMSDGIWENSKSMDKYWMFAYIDRALDGENIIEIGTETGKMYCNQYVYNGFSDMSDDQIREFFAKKIKQIAKIELKDNNKTTEWKRTNTEFKSCYLNYNEDISIADAYLCYEFLLGRNLSRWAIDQIKNIVGVKRSDKEIQIAEKKNELYNKYHLTKELITTEEPVIVIGTHALIQEDVDFKNLSLIPTGYSCIRDNHLVLFVEAEHSMGDYVEIVFNAEL